MFSTYGISLYESVPADRHFLPSGSFGPFHTQMLIMCLFAKV